GRLRGQPDTPRAAAWCTPARRASWALLLRQAALGRRLEEEDAAGGGCPSGIGVTEGARAFPVDPARHRLHEIAGADRDPDRVVGPEVVGLDEEVADAVRPRLVAPPLGV